MPKASSTHCSMPSRVNLANSALPVPPSRYERVLVAREEETGAGTANPRRTPLKLFRVRPRGPRRKWQDAGAAAHHHHGVGRRKHGGAQAVGGGVAMRGGCKPWHTPAYPGREAACALDPRRSAAPAIAGYRELRVGRSFTSWHGGNRADAAAAAN